MRHLNFHIKSLYLALVVLVPMTNVMAQMTNSGNFRTHVGSKIGLYGDFTNNGTFTSNLGEFHLVGTDSINLNGSNIFQVDSLIVDRDDDTKLDQEFQISSHATFSKGILYSDRSDSDSMFFHFTDDATHSGSSDTCFVDGVIRKTGDDAFVFPIGDYEQIQQAAITAPEVVTDHFTAYYHQVSPFVYGFDTYRKETSIKHVSLCEFWQIDRTGGTSDVAVQLYYDLNSCSVDSPCDLAVVRWGEISDTSMWRDHGNGGVTGTLVSGTVVSGVGCAVIDSITSFSPFTLASTQANNPLPVELINFDALLNNKGDVDLFWQTATEINNEKFILQHLNTENEWVQITEVDGAGNSQEVLDYFSLHRTPHQGMNYYRLQQYDYDGARSTSPVRSVWVESQHDFIVAPNPTKGEFVVQLLNNNLSVEEVRLFSPIGQEIDIQSIMKSQTDNSIHLNVESFAAGIYLVSVGDEQVKIVKI